MKFLLACITIAGALGCSAAAEKNSVVQTPATFCRVVPERAGDFAWENDKIAFRVYGPLLRKGGENNGIDCWLKRVDYPIINKWYGQMKTKSYHKDWGEGHDPYHVGSSAGCGGTGIWIDGKREGLETYTKWEILNSTPEKSTFVLSYQNEINDAVYKEEKTVSIKMGTQLFEVESVFYKNGEIAKGLEICVGLSTHNGKAKTFSSKQNGWIATWEKIEKYFVGTGVVVKPEDISTIKEIKSKDKDKSHLLIIMKTDDQGKIRYKSGYGWERAGTFKSADDWTNYLNKENTK